jgi:sugar lactone lactonase YvrE
MLHELQFPNGMALTPDGRTLVAAESYGKRLSAFDVAADGSSPVSREVLRVHEGGEVTHRLATPQQAVACALDQAGRTLYVATGRVMVTPEQARAARGGAIWRVVL